MSTFPLDQIDEHLRKQIVKKFTPFSGTAFYGSCRGAKDLIDRLKPLWDLPESRLDYIGNRKITIGNQWLFFPRGGTSANVPLEFCRIENVDVCSCKTDYIKAVILPQIAAVGGVGRLDIAWISDSDVQLLIATTKPETVALWDEHNDPTSATFENIKNLFIRVGRDNLESYWRTEKLFQLVRNRKSITLQLLDSCREIIANFIENWLKGQKMGTLEQLTVIPNLCIRTPDEDLMKRFFIETGEGYIVERGGLDRLRIAVDFTTLQVHFYLSGLFRFVTTDKFSILIYFPIFKTGGGVSLGRDTVPMAVLRFGKAPALRASSRMISYELSVFTLGHCLLSPCPLLFGI